MIILERSLTESKEEDGIAVTKEMTHVCSYSSQIIRPGKGLIAPPIKSPCLTLPLKLPVGVDDDDDHRLAMSQCKEKVVPTVCTTADVGTRRIPKSAEEMAAKRPSSAGHTSRKGSGDHKESLYSSKPKGVEGSAVSIVSSVYTPCLILLGTEQSHPKTDKDFNTVTTHFKRNALTQVQDTKQEHNLQSQPLKPLSMHKNTSRLDNKFEGRNIHQISSMPISSEDGCLQESTTQQRSRSFYISSDKSHERQRTGSFTGRMEQPGGEREHVFPLTTPSSTLKTQDLHKNAQVRASGRDPLQTGVTSIPAVSSKPRELTASVSAGQERVDSPANKNRDVVVETQQIAKEVDEANKEKMNMVSKEQKEERSAPEVKLHTISTSEFNVKQHNPEVRSLSTPWMPESTTPSAVGPNDSKAGPLREPCTVLRSPPLYNTELFISSESPVFSSIRPQSARRDQEKARLIRFPGKSVFVLWELQIPQMEGVTKELKQNKSFPDDIFFLINTRK